MITEVTITEGGLSTRYAQYCPTTDVTTWLEKLIRDVLLAPSNMRVVRIKGTSWKIDRKNVTSVTVARV